MANKTLKSVQEIQNLSFDETYNVQQVEPVVYNPTTGALDRMTQPTSPDDIQVSELIPIFRALLMAIANPSYVDKSANAIRNQVQSGTITTVTTVTTVSTLTNITGTFGSFTADHLHRMDNMTAWATNIRSLIT
jgi:hypothetical protein